MSECNEGEKHSKKAVNVKGQGKSLQGRSLRLVWIANLRETPHLKA